MSGRKDYYFSNRDLLVIAVLSGIGGVMSTYVGYLGNLLNRLFGCPSVPGSLPPASTSFGLFW